MNFKKAVFRVDLGFDGLQVHRLVEDHQMTSELDMYQLVQQHHRLKAQNHQILVLVVHSFFMHIYFNLTQELLDKKCCL